MFTKMEGKRFVPEGDQSFPRIPERSCASSTEPFMPSYDSRVGFTFSGVMNPMNLSDSLIVRVFS